MAKFMAAYDFRLKIFFLLNFPTKKAAVTQRRGIFFTYIRMSLRKI